MSYSAILIEVESSAIRAVSYDGYTLSVQFHTSYKTYEHHNFPRSLFEAFMSAPSLGKFYNQHIRGNFD